ncbi:MAG: hypothetical protein E6501_04275, partial [Bradyrhizobium sp.]|nr:hypothetical protein [Bradyrhizobium sp.]
MAVSNLQSAATAFRSNLTCRANHRHDGIVGISEMASSAAADDPIEAKSASPLLEHSTCSCVKAEQGPG